MKLISAIKSGMLVLGIGLLLSSPRLGAEEPRFDLLIQGARVLDGSGNPWFQADIGVKDGRIAALGQLDSKSVASIIDGRGRYVAPGFIDLHSLADEDDDAEAGLRSSNPLRRSAPNLISQGITTVVVNQDGRAPAALIGEQLKTLRSQPIGLNVALMAGHNTLRSEVLGDDYRRPSTAEEIGKMVELLQTAMRQGAWGLSTGLEYRPGSWSTTDELVALMKVLAPYDGVHISHVRAEGSAPIRWEPSQGMESGPLPSLEDGIQEIIHVAEVTSTRAVLSHLKARGRDMWGKSAEVIDWVEAARSRGTRLYASYYPYTSSFSDGVWPLIPSWARSHALRKARAEGVDADYSAAVRWALSKQETATALRNDITYLIQSRGGADQIWVLDHPTVEYRNRTLAQLAADEELEPTEMVIQLQLKGDPKVRGGGRIRSFSMSEHDVTAFASREWVAPVSDVGVHLPSEGSSVHARAYGTFSRHFGRISRDLGAMTLASAVRQATSLPAQIMGFRDRGMIREGLWADLVIFDPAEIADQATFENPHQHSKGIDYVLINGITVWSRGEATGHLPGQVLVRGH